MTFSPAALSLRGFSVAIAEADDRMNKRIAELEASIATLEARERRVRELVKPVGYASCNEEFNRGWDALSARILAILDEGAAE